MTDALLGPAQVRELAERHGIRPTKQRGQNFVIDPNTVRRIARVAELEADDVVLEVGPGLGSLTLALLPLVRRVIAVEIDETLAAALPQTIVDMQPDNASRLDVVLADAMQVSDLPEAPTAMVSNLPYNVAVPVLLHALERFPSIRRCLVMVQAEVADRLAAGPGSRTYGVPSVKARWYADVRLAGSVPPSVFWPAPRVDSGLLLLDRHDIPSTQVSRADVFAVIDAAFAQRRKGLRSALAGWAGGAAQSEEILRAAGIDPMARGEMLTIDDFVRIAEQRHAVGP